MQEISQGSTSGFRGLILTWKEFIEAKSIGVYYSSFVSSNRGSLDFQVITVKLAEDPGQLFISKLCLVSLEATRECTSCSNKLRSGCL